MKLIVDRKTLKLTLSRLLRTKRSSTLPVLNFVKLEAFSDGRLTLSMNNLEIAQKIAMEANVEEEGAILCPAAILSAALALMGEDEVRFSVKDRDLRVSCGGLVYELHSLPEEEFPNFPAAPDAPKIELVLSGTTLVWLIGSVEFSASDDATRYVLNGVALESFAGGSDLMGLRGIATDGKRLSVAECDELQGGNHPPFSLILPIETAKLLRKMAQDVGIEPIHLSADDKKLSLVSGNWRLDSSLVEGVFPEWRRVVPEAQEKNKLSFFASKWRESVSEVMAVSQEGAQLRISEGHLSLEGNGGRAENSFDFEGGQKVILNPEFLLEALDHCPAESGSLYLSKDSPLYFCAANDHITWQHVLMPMRDGGDAK